MLTISVQLCISVCFPQNSYKDSMQYLYISVSVCVRLFSYGDSVQYLYNSVSVCVRPVRVTRTVYNICTTQYQCVYDVCKLTKATLLGIYYVTGGTGMIASSSTFRPHPGRVIRDLFPQLHDVWHGTEALVYSNHRRAAAASSYLAIIFGRIASGVPWFLRSTALKDFLFLRCHYSCLASVLALV